MHIHCTLMLKNWDFPCTLVLTKAKRHYGADVNTSKAQFVLLLRIERTKKKRIEAQAVTERKEVERRKLEIEKVWKCEMKGRGPEAQHKRRAEEVRN